MSGRAGARAHARRSALLALSALYRISGRTGESRRAPGLTVLLLHNTPPAGIRQLARLVDTDRDLFVDFSAGVAASIAGDPIAPQVGISFDDGFASNLDAARMLSERDLSACFYVPTGVIGMDQPAVDQFFGRRQAEGVVAWDDLERLVANGHVVGSHSRRHVALSGLSESEAEDQLKGSVAELRARLGDVDHYAWPLGGLRHAPVENVVGWAADVGVVAASGVRGRNMIDRFAAEGYLRRDAVDLSWMRTDMDVFGVRDLKRR